MTKTSSHQPNLEHKLRNIDFMGNHLFREIIMVVNIQTTAAVQVQGIEGLTMAAIS